MTPLCHNLNEGPTLMMGGEEDRILPVGFFWQITHMGKENKEERLKSLKKRLKVSQREKKDKECYKDK